MLKKKTGSGVAHNPVSSLYAHCAVSPLGSYLLSGISLSEVKHLSQVQSSSDWGEPEHVVQHQELGAQAHRDHNRRSKNLSGCKTPSLI